ncbi:DUF1203 domain-containing protein [Pseudoalteromonas denitrificans]|uniref:DUF1203 domain-containing protein n=1 Tax=Pseudoalteromonas denitrificans DSM 6059 TaxID=1123010 RepID=A0A1I1S6G0_9GAMM|nr:DUF1203 domain-containing protein [Pseudoalteromonas denitrificans]SFD42154.1 Protein of unknown function [Pseudoalteromonas denitrificans DSM 6059]
MTIKFIIKAIPSSKFSEQLSQNLAHDAKWINVEGDSGYPCRVSLIDAKIGERVLALSFCHHDVSSPYKASGPIFIREKAITAQLNVNEIPSVLLNRLLSLRAYNVDHMMIGAEVVQGNEVSLAITEQFMNEDVAYIHIHNARPGCFSCAVYRA